MRPVLVIGPALGGATSVAAALRARFAVVETGAAPVVVLVVSAAAPMTRSDLALLDSHTGPVVGAVSKIDVHRTWRSVLEANRALLPVRWVGVAAAPAVGPVRVDDLVEAVRTALTSVPDPAPSAAPVRVPAPGPSLAAKVRLQQTRIESVAGVRAACAALRAELQADAAQWTRDADFVRHARRRIARVAAEVEADLTRRLGEGWPGYPGEEPRALADQPWLRPGALERRLATVFGTVFGTGVALTLGRALSDLVPADLAPGWAVAPTAASAAVGLILGLWVVRARRVLSERAAADRWVVEITAGLRSALEERVSARIVAAEVTLLTSGPFGGCPPS